MCSTMSRRTRRAEYEGHGGARIMWLVKEILEAIGLFIIGLAMVYVLMLLIEIKGWGPSGN